MRAGGHLIRRGGVTALAALFCAAAVTMGAGCGPRVSRVPPPSCHDQPLNPFCVQEAPDAGGDGAAD